MKRAIFLNMVVLGAVLALGAGCKGKGLSKGVTPIPRQQAARVQPDTTVKPPITPVTPVPPPSTTSQIPGGGATRPDEGPKASPLPVQPETASGIPTPLDAPEFENQIMDTNTFAAQTVYFEYDRSSVKPSEHSKLEVVAGQLKDKGEQKLLVDGHCDERGTQGYNEALGERRALALREYLVRLGISPERIYTRTWGEDRPADPGHDEAAWSKNRRGEFILLLPKK